VKTLDLYGTKIVHLFIIQTKTRKVMNTTQFDAHNKKHLTVELVGPSYELKIKGEGVFIIINPHGKFVSFSKSCHDACLGDVTEKVIHEYTNQQYADEYGDRMTGLGMTVRQYMQINCRMDIK